ncbi:MAG: hypothetical protein WBA76_16150 [Phormidesmis sp.]
MDSSSLQRLRIYLHLIPMFGVVPSLWTLYGKGSAPTVEITEDKEAAQLRSVSRLAVVVGLSCVSAIALLTADITAGATADGSLQNQATSLRLLIASSFIGSGYFLLNLSLMFRVAKGQSIRLPGITQLSRRLP